ncbi:hypothetical protein sS8_5551 [Methylocaldum marinum]|uniref:Uncharacterized protein n=1 Tax=Methylocaldum marinum TaxID=1432792 RepID=A0A286P496_9GAMM|nr:hypothetical protein sS8_5551 [Methylocaldum marinum]
MSEANRPSTRLGTGIVQAPHKNLRMIGIFFDIFKCQLPGIAGMEFQIINPGDYCSELRQ